MKKVWFITGAGSGAGTAQAALRAGGCVVATGRNLARVRDAYREVASERLAFVQLDVADEAQDDTVATKAALALGSKGNVSSETLRAFSEEEFRKIVVELP